MEHEYRGIINNHSLTDIPPPPVMVPFQPAFTPRIEIFKKINRKQRQRVERLENRKHRRRVFARLRLTVTGQRQAKNLIRHGEQATRQLGTPATSANRAAYGKRSRRHG